MVGLDYELQAFYADNGATEGRATEISIQIENSQGHISLSPAASNLQSAYVFSIDDASLVGFGQLPEDRWGGIVVLATSMCCERVFLSPVLLRVSIPQLTRRTGMYGTLTSRVISGEVEIIKEEQFLDLSDRLLKLEAKTGLQVENLRHGLVSYYWAALSIDPSTRYSHLWASLEKSVNAHADCTGKKFDHKAASLVGSTSEVFESLRKVNDRLKHAFRNQTDVEFLNQVRPTVQKVSKELKRLAGAALQVRLKELT